MVDLLCGIISNFMAILLPNKMILVDILTIMMGPSINDVTYLGVGGGICQKVTLLHMSIL